MNFNFVCDRIVKGKAYPALAQHQAEPYTPAWQEFVKHYPYTVPCELIEHCAEFDYPHQVYSLDEAYPAGSYYIIGIGFFDFTIDYFSLMSERVIGQLRTGNLRALFYYHEGDFPTEISQRLDTLAKLWSIPRINVQFVTGNSAVSGNRGFRYFPDHELLYWRRNNTTLPTPINLQPREKDFTVLSRTHKWWRATAMADLHRNNLLDNSYWSYRTDVSVLEDPTLNPIRVDDLNLQYSLTKFLEGTPYTCDTLTADDHNNHALVESQHYTDSYCNIVLETLYDAGGGTFLTEKTFKPIKHGQPFIVVGPPGSLAILHQLGYRTFDHIIDPAYDSELDNTERWRKIYKEIVRIKEANKSEWFAECYNDIVHNQQLFAASKFDRLNTLRNQLIIR